MFATSECPEDQARRDRNDAASDERTGREGTCARHPQPTRPDEARERSPPASTHSRGSFLLTRLEPQGQQKQPFGSVFAFLDSTPGHPAWPSVVLL